MCLETDLDAFSLALSKSVRYRLSLQLINCVFFFPDLPWVWVKDYEFSTCLLSKCGSTTWTYQILNISTLIPMWLKKRWIKSGYFIHQSIRGSSEIYIPTLKIKPQQQLSLALIFSEVYPLPTKGHDFRDMSKQDQFVFVRHPFVRFVSAFRSECSGLHVG